MTALHTRAMATVTMALLGGAAPSPAVAGDAFVPSGHLRPDDVTVLMAVDAPLPEGTQPFQPGGHGKFYVEGWCRPQQAFRWQIVVPAEDAYGVSILARRQSGPPLDLTLTCAGQSLPGYFDGDVGAWDRQTLNGALRLPAGPQTLALTARTPEFAASLLSVELARPAIRDQLQAAALRTRADTTWLQQARCGIMCHWTSESWPRRGPRRPYLEAVQAFDVPGFADQVAATGAGFLVLTTSHAEMRFPAPIEALDHILPGRTASRDLVAELATALRQRGIRLMLYYHLGSGSDPDWLRACGFWETDTQRLFGHWVAVVGEVGRRYGEALAGWWFDDGAVSYYYRSAPWERLTQAARDGYPQRLVGYNPWELPAPTPFQDFFCGEGHGDPGANGRLQPEGTGRLLSGPHAGLQACATLVTEGDWVHNRPDTDIGPPRWTATQLATLLQDFARYRSVPIFNLEVYQEGRLSPATVEVFRQATRSGR